MADPFRIWYECQGNAYLGREAYLSEFVFRFNRRFYPFNGFRSLLGLGACAESPTYEALYAWELTG